MIARIKQNAKRALTGNWGKAIAILLILFAVSMLFVFFEALFYWIFQFTGQTGPVLSLDFIPPDYPLLSQARTISLAPQLVSLASMVCGLLVLSPLSLGVTKWYYATAGGEAADASAVFHFFSQRGLYFKSVWYHVQITVRSFLWGAALFAPGLVLFALCSYYLERPGEDMQLTAISFGLVLSCVLLVLCALVLILVLLRYFLAPYYLVHRPELTVSEAIQLSIQGTREQKGNLLLFGLSFLPWALAGLLVLPLLYVLPYLMASRALYAKVLITREERKEPEEIMEEE